MGVGVETTSSHVWSDASGPAGLSLLVFAGGARTPRVALLPDHGEVMLGRAPTGEGALAIDDGSVSREHAVLTIAHGARGAAPSLQLRDLGSRNGTRIGGQVAPTGTNVAVAPGQAIELGSVVILVRYLDASSRAVDAPSVASGESAKSPKMHEVDALVDLVAPTPVTALLLGETGVGKTAIADRIHVLSRRPGAIVKLNCAAVPESLLEAELFGFERGAFTGAQAAKAGLIEAATHGTLLLDEIGDMPLATQAKLLHVVEHGEVMRLGATTPRSVDVRFLAATHKNLDEMVAAKTFRADLYYRINTIAITIPPLRERPEEIASLASHFLTLACTKMNRPVARIGGEALQALRAHSWPGNLRELRNVMERAALLTPPSEDVAVRTLGLPAPAGSAPDARRTDDAAGGGDLRTAIDSFEKEKIVRALEEAGGNQARAAELVGLPLRTFVKRLTHHGLTKPRKR